MRTEKPCGIAEAFFRLGRVRAAADLMGSALVRLGHHIPTGKPHFAIRTLQLVFDQTTRRFGLARRRSNTKTAREIDELACDLYDRIALVAFFDLDTNLTIFSILSFLSTAERLGPSDDWPEPTRNMCGASGLIPVHALARVYHRRALETVEAIGAEGTLAYALTLQRIRSTSAVSAIGR